MSHEVFHSPDNILGEEIEIISDHYLVGKVHRTKTPTGWLVFTGSGAITFVYDPEHKWVNKE